MKQATLCQCIRKRISRIEAHHTSTCANYHRTYHPNDNAKIALQMVVVDESHLSDLERDQRRLDSYSVTPLFDRKVYEGFHSADAGDGSHPGPQEDA